MNIDKALERLYSLRQLGVKLGLHNIIKILDHLDNPQNDFKSIHVAGSNGKGSTASFIASILMEAGFKVGLFTSPHYVKFNERFRINGKMISDDYIAGFINELEEYINNNEITFFEISTALGFKYFRDSNVDIAVIETGLGGRLDATNTLLPEASVITTISLEHTKILGDTLEKVTAEKAGIIKNNSNVFIGDMATEAVNVLKSTADEKKSNSYDLKDYCEFNRDSLQLRLKNKTINLYTAPLRGYHQLKNAALAILTLNKSFEVENLDNIFDGINNVIDNCGIEGRYEVYSEKPKIIFDSAHNPQGMNAFVDEFKKEKNNYVNRIAVFGAMSDKNLDEMFRTFAPEFSKIFITTINTERAASIDELKNTAEKINIEVEAIENVENLIINFNKTNKNDCLVILGSIYLVGEIKSKLSNKSRNDLTL
ncbi:MAG: bifunctional folylpolyglutamate synthase/dihydrofolate synthase [Ignavibacteriae bacterium]|nr:bifunctional folylpolyglutamate synthase/dihydrofolate synthase [Ignavibacteriota bacterium]NOG98201.1 bifunctional folylpolyglutamate synthase/dihydrofolate synthase [Ignavibacteriota bacterium]